MKGGLHLMGRRLGWQAKVVYSRLTSRLGYRYKTWIIGDGRSGTTWLQELMNLDGKSRLIFEPLHPMIFDWVPKDTLLYLRRSDTHPVLSAVLDDLLSGRIGSGSRSNLDRFDARPSWGIRRSIVVKDIFAHFLAGWLQRHYPEVRIIVLLRHPYEVALSKMKLSDWQWIDQPLQFIQNEKLCKDHLESHRDFIHAFRGDFSRYVMSWALKHFVLFRTIDMNRVHLLFYEHLKADTFREINAVMEYHLGAPGYTVDRDKVDLFNRPSKTSVGPTDADRDFRKHHGSWWDDRPGEVDSARQILEHFGLGDLYGPDGMPARNVDRAFIEKIQKL